MQKVLGSKCHISRAFIIRSHPKKLGLKNQNQTDKKIEKSNFFIRYDPIFYLILETDRHLTYICVKFYS